MELSNRPQSGRMTEHIRAVYGVEPEHLWANYPNYAVFRHPGSKKWFAVLMDVPRCKLGLDGEERVELMDIKCSPLMTGSLLSEEGFLPAYHMNKNTWISVLLADSVPDEKIAALLDFSYDSSAPKRKK